MSLISPAVVGCPPDEIRGGVAAVEDLSPRPRLHIDFMGADFASASPISHEHLWLCVELFDGESEVHLQTRDLPLDRALSSSADNVIVPVELPEGLEAWPNVVASGRGFGLAISPSTDLQLLVPHLESVDSVTVMTSQPGTSDYEPRMLERIKTVRAHLNNLGRSEVKVIADGGMTRERIASVVGAGADVCVCASAVFKSPQGIGPAYADLLAEALGG